MRIGCSTITFRSEPVERACERIASLGMSVIDLGAVPGWCDHVRLTEVSAGGHQPLAEVVRLHGFDVAAVQAVPWHPNAIDDADELSRRYSIAVDAARATGARALLVDPGMVGGVGRSKALDRFKRTITMAAELAAARDVRLAIEAPNQGTLAETLPQTMEVLEYADVPTLGVDVDTRHVLSCGASSGDVVGALGDRVVHVACRDGLDSGESCTPGDGAFDFAEFFELLGAASYEGAITMELIPGDDDMTPAHREREAIRARDHLEPLLTEAGLS